METKAVDNFNSGYNCAQAVLSVFCGDDGDRLLMAATSFGGGIAGTGHMCGCLSGALFAIGLLQGKTTINNPANRKENYAIARTLCERFKKRIRVDRVSGIDKDESVGRQRIQESRRLRPLQK